MLYCFAFSTASAKYCSFNFSSSVILYIYFVLRYKNNYFFDIFFVYYFLNILNIKQKILWGLGIGDWGLGIGDWAQSPIPNPQSPIPNPQSP
jgi:hypothetical protein